MSSAPDTSTSSANRPCWVLPPSRGPALSCTLAAFLALGAFLGAVALGLPPLALFWPLGAPFFVLAPFFEKAFSDATFAPCSATAAAFSVVSAFSVVIFVRSPSAGLPRQ